MADEQTYGCVRHPDRLRVPQDCVVAAADPARTDDYVCTCCDDCIALCRQLDSDNNAPHTCDFTIPFDGRMVCHICGTPQP